MQCSSNSCSSGCGGHVVPCPCPEEGNIEIDSLEKVVNCYWQHHQDVAVELEFYESLESLTEAIEEAAAALADENLGYDQPDILSGKVLLKARQELSDCEAELAKSADFDTLFNTVDSVIGTLDGLNPALVYLTALRIGVQLGVHPQSIVLAAGAQSGAEALLAIDAGKKFLLRDELPRIFQHPELTTADVQACLTICKNQLRWLSRN